MMRLLLSVLSTALKSLTVLLAVVIINFTLVHIAPGDPVSVLAGEAGASDEQFVAQLRHEFRLDQPIMVQLAHYVGSMATLDLGYSYRQHRPVWDLILERLSATMILVVPAFIIALFGGILFGTLASRFRGRWLDTVITVGSLVFYATPIVWSGLLLILFFSVFLGVLPAFGMSDITDGAGGLSQVLDIARHAILPIATLAGFYLAIYTRLTRASMNEVQTLDFVKTAWAKGLSGRRVVWVHQLRNAVLPVITLAGMQAGHLIGGSILVETVFAWPGIGRLAFDSLLQRDYPVLLGVFFCTAVLVIIFNIAADILYRIVDPRIED